LIVDAHLDIAFNALSEGRGFESEPAPGYVVSRTALARAGVGLVFPTIYCSPASRGGPRVAGTYTYATPREAHLMGRAQAVYYRSVGLDLVHDREALDEYVSRWRRGRLAGVLLMEGADPIEDPSQLGAWVDLGVRIVGLAWSRTRYSGGTWDTGGLTELGLSLLKAMRRKHVILDLSHMAQQAVEEAFPIWTGPVMASHSNARELVPGERQLAAATVAELARRGGMVGISFAGGHLRRRKTDGRPDLADVVDHVVHHARSAGSAEHVGLGTDLDGGFPAAWSPVDRMEELAELRRLLRRRFTKADVDGIMGDNWIAFLRRSLPARRTRKEKTN
jgi:membrane dipeptidase